METVIRLETTKKIKCYNILAKQLSLQSTQRAWLSERNNWIVLIITSLYKALFKTDD